MQTEELPLRYWGKVEGLDGRMGILGDSYQVVVVSRVLCNSLPRRAFCSVRGLSALSFLVEFFGRRVLWQVEERHFLGAAWSIVANALRRTELYLGSE